MKLIRQVEPWINSAESEYIKKIVNKGYLTENLETKKFENNFKKKFKVNNSLAVSNWTAGIFLCLKAIGVKKNDEIIVPNLTFVATITPVLMAGAKPVLCDVDENNFNLDINKVKKLISKKTKCIIPVHLYGHCCDMKKLVKICKKKNIYLLEDAAQAIGAKYNGKYLGTFGDFGGFSFYGNKIITTGEGGIIFSKNKKFAKKMYALKNHGRAAKGDFKHEMLGYNFMFTEMQAAIGNIQLKKLSKILNKKKKIYNFYKKNLKIVKEIKFMQGIDNNEPVYWFTNIIIKQKEKLKKFLYLKKIQTRDIFFPINEQPCFKGNKNIVNLKQKFPVSKQIYNTGLSLPSSYRLKENQLRYIVKNIKEFYNK